MQEFDLNLLDPAYASINFHDRSMKLGPAGYGARYDETSPSLVVDVARQEMRDCKSIFFG